MKVRLTVQHKKANVKTVVLYSDAVIGRSTECNLRLASGQISRKHCKLLINDERVAIEDLGSANGTYLNKEKLESKSVTTISPGDVISIGSVSFAIAYNDPVAETKIRKTAPVVKVPDSSKAKVDTDSSDITPTAGTPVFAQSASDDDEDSSGDVSGIDVDELSDEELEALLADEDFEEDEEQLSIELNTEEDDSGDQFSESEETLKIAPEDNPMLQEEFATPATSEAESETDEDDEEDEEDVMNFLQDLGN
ncbi:MAG: FHA domain-containing protein [Planctomycetaceae bacterium]|nr:FHA domain-containing protein [bacterium]MDB4680063.1 FHA domain-containing protein [Planctomycetaceae bacterium]MDB4786983.1 FHA domain-containing protein [Planctomycetaceae bacterium]MDC0273132.1 FHA domain-containing protein [Planctomycetaceae bacterium]MDG2391765.1 FHA domain-containing protein [Planctomycetaceae bacterium]